MGWPPLGLAASAAGGPCVLGTPRSQADQRRGRAALGPHLLMEPWRTEATVLLGTKRRCSCPVALRGPPGTRKGVQQRARRGRPRSGGHVHVLPRHPWHPRSGEEAWQPAGGEGGRTTGTETLVQQVLWGILKRDAMRTGSGRHQSCETDWMPAEAALCPSRHVGQRHRASARDLTG